MFINMCAYLDMYLVYHTSKKTYVFILFSEFLCIKRCHEWVKMLKWLLHRTPDLSLPDLITDDPLATLDFGHDSKRRDLNPGVGSHGLREIREIYSVSRWEKHELSSGGIFCFVCFSIYLTVQNNALDNTNDSTTVHGIVSIFFTKMQSVPFARAAGG